MIDAITGLDIFSPITVAVRLLFSIVAGFMIGFERERHFQPAGLRTHMVLALGACSIMIVSIYIPAIFLDTHPNSDPGRIAAQVISGIGFLGAGAIFRFGFDVRGVTTAATIWTTSGIGIAFGAGFYILGSFGTILLIVILQVFDKIETRLIEKRKLRVLRISFCSDKLEINEIIKTIERFDIDIRRVSITEDVEKKITEIVIDARMDQDFDIGGLFERIKSLGNIYSVKIE